MNRVEREAERRRGEAVGEKTFGRRVRAAIGEAGRGIDHHAPDLLVDVARIEEIAAVPSAGDVLDPGHALTADAWRTRLVELREQMKGLVLRDDEEAGYRATRLERHLVQVLRDAGADLELSEAGAGIGAVRRERETGKARDAGQRVLLLGARQPAGPLREVGRRIVAVEEGAARPERDAGVEPRFLRKRRRAVEDLDRRAERRDAHRARVARDAHGVERAARLVGGADGIERRAVGREPKSSIRLGEARGVRRGDRERGGVGQCDGRCGVDDEDGAQ
jgi:hypothetical protein